MRMSAVHALTVSACTADMHLHCTLSEFGLMHCRHAHACACSACTALHALHAIYLDYTKFCKHKILTKHTSFAGFFNLIFFANLRSLYCVVERTIQAKKINWTREAAMNPRHLVNHTSAPVANPASPMML